KHGIVNVRVDDGARARGTFLSLKTEGRLNNSRRGVVKVCVRVNDDSVLAAHLRHNALNPELTFLNFRGALVDSQSNLFRACECNEARQRMVNYHVSDFCAR